MQPVTQRPSHSLNSEFAAAGPQLALGRVSIGEHCIAKRKL